MKEIDKSIPMTQDGIEKIIVTLAPRIKEIFPNNDCYFIGSICINNIEKSDIDFVVLMKREITVTELRLKRKQVSDIDSRLQMMMCFASDQEDLTTLPYISMQDTSKRLIVDREDFEDNQFKQFKDSLYNHLWKKRKFNKTIIKDIDRKKMRKQSVSEKQIYLGNL